MHFRNEIIGIKRTCTNITGKGSSMALHPNAGKPAKLEDLQNIPRLISAYYLK